MEELVISIRNYNNKNYKKIINNIKKSGFKNVFIEWYNKDLVLQNKLLKYVRRVGLNIVFAHLGYQNLNVIWKPGIEGEKEVERYIEDIKICKKNGINFVVIHPTLGFENPGINELGLNRIKKIVDYSEKNNIKVAFENVELKGYLEYLVNNIDNKNFGICYDVGHCHLFYDDEFDTTLFKNKVLAIHLHDNFKEYDNHNLPFDGTVDWELHLKKIIDMNYKGYIIIESGYNSFYKDINLEKFYKIAYERGIKLIEMYKEYSNK